MKEIDSTNEIESEPSRLNEIKEQDTLEHLNIEKELNNEIDTKNDIKK